MTKVHIYPDLSSSRLGLFQVSIGKTVSRCAMSAADILNLVHDIKRGKWWSMDVPVMLVRHNIETQANP